MLVLFSFLACDVESVDPGTQIGVEDHVDHGCEVLSIDVVTDVDEVPDSFTQSLQQAFDQHLGIFEGGSADDEAAPPTVEWTLETSGAAELHRFEVELGEDGTALATDCPSRWRIPVSASLQGPTIGWSGDADLWIDESEQATLHIKAGIGDIEPIPSPVLVDPKGETTETGIDASRLSNEDWLVEVWWAEEPESTGSEDEAVEYVREVVWTVRLNRL